MRRHTEPVVGALLLSSLALAPLAWGRHVVVQHESPFRSGPNQKHRAMGTVAQGTTGEVVGQVGGWVQLKLDDGRTGYVFQTNVRDVPDESTTTSTAPGPDATVPTSLQPSPPTTVPSTAPPRAIDDPASLKTEIAALREKLDTLTKQLGTEAAHADAPAADAPPREGVVSWAIAALLVGMVFGWLFSWALQRRTDRRQWNRLRL